jgi:hypothetical protein
MYTPNTQIYDRYFSVFGTGTSIKKNEGAKLALYLICCFLFQPNDDKAQKRLTQERITFPGYSCEVRLPC